MIASVWVSASACGTGAIIVAIGTEVVAAAATGANSAEEGAFAEAASEGGPPPCHGACIRTLNLPSLLRPLLRCGGCCGLAAGASAVSGPTFASVVGDWGMEASTAASAVGALAVMVVASIVIAGGLVFAEAGGVTTCCCFACGCCWTPSLSAKAPSSIRFCTSSLLHVKPVYT